MSFQGEGPEGLAEYGYSRDRRPDLKQIVVAVAMTKGGVPIAHEVFLGSTSDVRSFARAISSLKARFPIGRVIVVSDRGKRYIVCLNEEEAERDRETREEMVGKLREKLSRGGPM